MPLLWLPFADYAYSLNLRAYTPTETCSTLSLFDNFNSFKSSICERERERGRGKSGRKKRLRKHFRWKSVHVDREKHCFLAGGIFVEERSFS